ncbi:hypothetical protein AB6C46_18500 [Vibrio sp. 10N.237.312.C02]|uniref:hypothetical protein n=4 Tax=Vibrionaceae TaxID=641 RepID=UPI00352D3293
MKIDIDTVLLVIITIECVNVLISVISIKAREESLKIWRNFPLKKDYNIIVGYKDVFIGDALSFFATHSFVILVFVQLDYGYQSIGSFAFISGFSYLAFSAISIPSRYESIWVNNSMKCNKPYYDRKLLAFHVVMFQSILISMYIFKQPIIEYVFKGQHGELYDYIYLILLSFVVSGFNYSLSPVIVLERKFYAFSLSSIIPLIPSAIVLYNSVNIESGFFYLFLTSMLKSLVLNVMCYKSNKEIIKSNIEVFFLINLISMIILFVAIEYDVTHIISKLIVIDGFLVLFATSLPIFIFLLTVLYLGYVFVGRFKKRMSNL